MADQFYQNNAYFNGSDVVGEAAELYEPRAGMSIENDQLYMNFWLTKNGTVISSGLGDAEYRVFDRDAALVAGLSETGLAADVEGFYTSTPVASTNLEDLNHYIVEVTISYDGQDRVARIPVGIVE
jgi:hypothetical protein